MELKEINVSDILANFYQPRTKFDKEGIQELAESILSNGLINPITVKEYKNGKYMIVSGERRWRAHKVAGLKTIPCFVKEYKNDGQFMIESLIENIHREDLSSMEKAKFIKAIWEKMGKPTRKVLAQKLCMGEDSVLEHLSLVDDKTPREVKKAVQEGKLAMRSASMISKLPEKEQVMIAKESMKRETGIGRSEVEKLIEDKRPEPIKLEETANNVVNTILSNLHDFKYNVDILLKEMNIEDLSKLNANKAMTTAGLHIKVFKDFVNALRKRGATPHPLILDLIKANGKI